MDTEGIRRPATFAETVESYLSTADYLDESHGPSVKLLQALAMELDREVTAALSAQFGLVHRGLLKERPSVAGAVNPYEELLRR